MKYENNRAYLADFLTRAMHDVDFGPVVRSYRLDKRNLEYYFFAKCPEEVLDVNVYETLGGELHQADSSSFLKRRFLFVKNQDEKNELDELMQRKGYESHDDHYQNGVIFAFKYQDGIVYASKSCRKFLGESPYRQR